MEMLITIWWSVIVFTIVIVFICTFYYFEIRVRNPYDRVLIDPKIFKNNKCFNNIDEHSINNETETIESSVYNLLKTKKTVKRSEIEYMLDFDYEQGLLKDYKIFKDKITYVDYKDRTIMVSLLNNKIIEG